VRCHLDLLALRYVRRRAECDALAALQALAQFNLCAVVTIHTDLAQVHAARIVHCRHAKAIGIEQQRVGRDQHAFTASANGDLPVEAAALVASPFDFSKVPLVAPLRPIDAVTRGQLVTQLYRALGGAPAPLVKRGYQIAGIDKYVMKPWTILSHADDRELLAQIEAVDAFMGDMTAYPGRSFGQLYHRFFRTNDLAEGRLELGPRVLDLAGVRVPVLAIAGQGDGIAPVAACHHVADLLPQAPSVRLETAPGGHLGVLTGRAARTTTWPLLDEFLAGPRARRRAAA